LGLWDKYTAYSKINGQLSENVRGKDMQTYNLESEVQVPNRRAISHVDWLIIESCTNYFSNSLSMK